MKVLSGFLKVFGGVVGFMIATWAFGRFVPDVRGQTAVLFVSLLSILVALGGLAAGYGIMKWLTDSDTEPAKE